jgi:hypothetical protein
LRQLPLQAQAPQLSAERAQNGGTRPRLSSRYFLACHTWLFTAPARAREPSIDVL